MKKIIAAVRNDKELKKAASTEVETIFMLSPNIENLKAQVELIHQNGKKIFIHIDLAEGIGKDEYGLLYVKKLGVDGIISTRTNLIKAARKNRIFTVQRFFIVDSHSIKTSLDSIKASGTDMIEIMPGTVSKIIKRIKGEISMPIVAGGLIETAEEVKEAIACGASAVSVGVDKINKLITDDENLLF